MGGTVNQQEQFDEPKANGHAILAPRVTLRHLAARLTPNPALTVDGTLQVILDGIDKLDEEELARSIARANKGQQIGGDPGPISDEQWSAADPAVKERLLEAAEAMKIGLRLMAE
jgi:hypothetical protein